MKTQVFFTMAAIVFAGQAAAQTFDRRANVRPDGPPGEGRCSVEVVVDGVAEIEIRGDDAAMRNLGGQAPQWRRFDCTRPLPPDPGDFRFRGLEGRGKQQLIRDPRNGGTAVIRIEDPQPGAGRYMFELAWAGRGGSPERDFDRDRDRGDRDRDRDRADRDRDRDDFYRGREDYYRRDDWRPRFFQHVREDLEHVRSVTFPIGADQYRLARTLQELDELQDKLARHYYDERELNDVIESLDRVLRDNRLSWGNRDALTEDLNRMREFREHHEEWWRR
jgi:hypothetical protein